MSRLLAPFCVPEVAAVFPRDRVVRLAPGHLLELRALHDLPSERLDISPRLQRVGSRGTARNLDDGQHGPAAPVILLPVRVIFLHQRVTN